ncbi:cytochrome p450 family 4 [Holotrichia oblita]|uniref:Cytochrome p450 family 4 n=1 Tax=Holotrichia oblita TaxID=644536 RepID=A0ACB9T2V9_HOLOL|nr:cytochrome p450 family 4 [Holotrichia oblita]
MRQFSLIGRNEELYKYTLDYSDWSKCVNKIKSFSENVIQEKHKQWEIRKQHNEKPDAKEPFLDLLFRVWDKGEISMEEIREELDTFMFAGHDTTAATISFCLFELAKHQDVQEKILEEVSETIGESDDFTISNLSNLKYLDTVVKEVMRIYTTVPLIERAVADHLELNGKVIPIGTTLLLFLYGLHNSEKNYVDAKKFDPSRFSSESTVDRDPFSYVPFSAGARNCIGQRFALLEVKASLVKIMKKFILLPVEPEHNLQLAANTILKSLNGVPIRVKRRS